MPERVSSAVLKPGYAYVATDTAQQLAPIEVETIDHTAQAAGITQPHESTEVGAGPRCALHSCETSATNKLNAAH